MVGTSYSPPTSDDEEIDQLVEDKSQSAAVDAGILDSSLCQVIPPLEPIKRSSIPVTKVLLVHPGIHALQCTDETLELGEDATAYLNSADRSCMYIGTDTNSSIQSERRFLQLKRIFVLYQEYHQRIEQKYIWPYKPLTRLEMHDNVRNNCGGLIRPYEAWKNYNLHDYYGCF